MATLPPDMPVLPGGTTGDLGTNPATRPPATNVRPPTQQFLAPPAAPPQTGSFIVPVAGVSPSQLQDSFHFDRDGGKRKHAGIDIFAPRGTPVLASVSGVVVKAGTGAGGSGKRVWVKDAEGRFHFYAHLDTVTVKEGQTLAQGAILGTVGDTGNARGTSPHLHYSINSTPNREDGRINPYDLLVHGTAVPTEALSDDQVIHFDFDDPLAAERAQDPLAAEGFTVDPRDVLLGIMDGMSNLIAGGQRIHPREFENPLDDLNREEDEDGDATQRPSARRS